MKKNIIVSIIILVVVIGAIFIGLNFKKDNQAKGNKISMVTTLFPLYDFAKNIGQDKVDVLLLLPPGVGPHSFEPKPSDIIKINESDLFVYTGKFMEPWAEDVINGISEKDVRIVDASIGIKLMKEEDHEVAHEEEEHGHEHDGIDPHVWLDFDNSKIMIDNIVATMSEKDPVNSSFYQKNATEYKNKLTQLDNQYKNSLTQCESKDIIYSGHYAFGYMSKKYGLAYESAYGISPDSEPSAQDLIKLIEQIKKAKIKFIFAEKLLSPRIAETLAKETGAGILFLNPAGNLPKEDFENNVSFLSIMEENLANLKTALVCSN